MTEDVANHVVEAYGVERTEAFRASLVFLIFVSLAGLVVTTGLTDKKLVEKEQVAVAPATA